MAAESHKILNPIMKSIKILIFAALAAFTFGITACQKDPVVEPTPIAKTCYMAKKIYSDSSNQSQPVTTENYEYDANNRVVKITDNTSISTITYNGNITSVVQVPNTGTNIIRTTITNNGDGNAIQKITEQNNLKDTTKFEYDANGYISKEITKTFISTYTVVNGNVTTVINTDKITNALNWTLTIEYAPQLNKTKVFEVYQKLGKLDKNVANKATLNFSNNTQLNINRILTFDNEGYLTKVNQENTTINTGVTPNTSTKRGFSYDYAYTCK
jgi:YD repeat-containing protein